MSENRRTIAAAPDRVWDVLADGWLYPLFVVGASRVRDVDRGWPQVGTRIHHSVGTWPLLIDDHTEVLEADPEERLTLRARGWPAGEATVTFELAPDGTGTSVTILEDAAAGPGVLVPRPVRDVALRWRNSETLRRLAYVVEGRT
ncbi:SRPBCC family protein [Nocardioides zeae]|uniref:SRPBCC family protein n=1 Tax=Nocardioides imazamoxiresistens TaxID=3231893 RepID=A0ABU3PWY5_9ACTN|nr:SRPBCC family protein [Nocardioides zeae]MDT9593701.1 SRPBCC family protein [Nocardioides zeae]